MKRTNDTIYLLDNGGDLQRVPRHHYESEDLLQRLIEKYPEVLAGDQMDGDETVRFLLVKREAGIPDGEGKFSRWAVDHLLLDQNAVPTLVEVKRSSDTRIRREVVGQLLEYAANVDVYWPADKIRALATEEYHGVDKLERQLCLLLDLNPEEENGEALESYWSNVEENMRNGKMRLLFVADELPSEVRRIIEFLNMKMMDVEVLGVELRQYVGKDLRAMVPRVIGQTEATKRAKSRRLPKKPKTTREELLRNCDPKLRDFISNVLDEAEQRELAISWGTRSFSLRAPDARGKMNSMIYCYSPGDEPDATARIECYLDEALRGTEFETQISEKYLAIEGFEKQGRYTFSLKLTPQTLDSASRAVKIVWEIPAIISRL